jgi:gas vesicle protein
MKSFAVFLLGIIVGVVVTLYYPVLTAHPDQVNAELRKELNALQSQIHDLGNQLKNLKIPEPGGNNAGKESPSPSASPSPQ